MRKNRLSSTGLSEAAVAETGAVAEAGESEEMLARWILPEPNQKRTIGIWLISGAYFQFESRRNRYGIWRWVISKKNK